jgi:hypothetical protein
VKRAFDIFIHNNYEKMRAFSGHQGFGLGFSRVSCILRSLGGLLGGRQAFANENQLTPKQSKLSAADDNQEKSYNGERVRRAVPPSFLLFLLMGGIASFCGDA